LGNLIDWQLMDQQGQRLSTGTYLFLVTVKDFSDRLTQKYGTAVLESAQVYLEQTSRGELPAAQATALAANQQAEALSAVDRIGAAGSNPTTTTSPTGQTTTGTEASGTSTAEATTVTGENATGTGTQNYIAKWTDNAGTLGDSSIFENSSGQVGIGTSSPETKLHVVAPAVPGRETVARFGISDDPNNYVAIENGGSTPGLFTPVLLGNSAAADGAAINIQGRIVPGADTGELAVFAMDAYRSSFSPIINRPIFRIRNWDQEYFKILANGNVGIGTTAPSHRLSINGGPFWTTNAWNGAVELTNASAIGWQANAGGQRFGIGQSTGGLYFFRTTSDPGTTGSPANYDMVITDVGNVGIGITNPETKLHVDGGRKGAISGISTTSTGVFGSSVSRSGVSGSSERGIGVSGYSDSGPGVFGSSVSDYAGLFSGTAKVTGHLEVGSCTGCTISSDQNLKANFSTISPRSVLDRLAALPIRAWNYKSDAPSVRHVGPMAQDFRAAFDLGKDDLHIDMIDANGVTMASIQALYQMMLEKEKKNERQSSQIHQQGRQIAQLQAQLNQVRRSVRRRAAKR
jgi:hypothetical protein